MTNHESTRTTAHGRVDDTAAVTDAAPAPSYADRVLGCLLGTLTGDAFGVLHAAGDDPVRALGEPAGAVVSDATQLTLYTVDALTEALEWANDGVAADETACVWLAYLRWLGRQGEHLPANAPTQPGRWIDRQDLPVTHGHDADTLAALLTGEMGTRARPLNPRAEGPGALMRSAPFGLVPRIPAGMVERLTIEAAALTHGSEAARGAAARYSSLIRVLTSGSGTLEDALLEDGTRSDQPSGAATTATRRTPSRPTSGTAAVGTATADVDPTDGTTASATLDAALQAVRAGASARTPAAHLETALTHAAGAARPGASGAVAASLAGGIVGALHGTRALPPACLTADGAPALVREMARRLLTATTGT